jgi:hypothetical protein
LWLWFIFWWLIVDPGGVYWESDLFRVWCGCVGGEAPEELPVPQGYPPGSVYPDDVLMVLSHLDDNT